MLPKKYRITKIKDFQNIFKKGKFFRGKIVDLKIAKNKCENSRFGFSIGLKISKKAVCRNRLRRQLQEIIFSLRGSMADKFDTLVVPHKEAMRASYEEKKKDIEETMAKAGILKEEKNE